MIFVLDFGLKSFITLFCCSNVCSFEHWDLWLLRHFDTPLQGLCVCVCVCTLPFTTFLLSVTTDTPGSHNNFCILVLELAIFQGWCILLENVIRNQDLGIEYACWCWGTVA